MVFEGKGDLSSLMVKKGSLVYVRYWDHVLFRNADPNLYGPTVREAVGWVVKENEEAVWILWDRSIVRLPQERTRPEESGLIVLKREILELRRLSWPESASS